MQIKTRISIALVLSLLLLAGCRSLTGYPAAGGHKPGQCPDISGTYYDIVDEAYSYNLQLEPELISCEPERDSGTIAHKCTLNAWLNPKYLWISKNKGRIVEACPNKTITIKQPDSDSIDVIVKRNGSVTNQFRLSSKWEQFSCKNGTIILESLGIKSRWGHGGPPKSFTWKGEEPEKYYLYAWTSEGLNRLWGGQQLYKHEDGSLVLKFQWHGLISYGQYDWYKWQRVSDNNGPSIICPK